MPSAHDTVVLQTWSKLSDLLKVTLLLPGAKAPAYSPPSSREGAGLHRAMEAVPWACGRRGEKGDLNVASVFSSPLSSQTAPTEPQVGHPRTEWCSFMWNKKEEEGSGVRQTGREQCLIWVLSSLTPTPCVTSEPPCPSRLSPSRCKCRPPGCQCPGSFLGTWGSSHSGEHVGMGYAFS